MKIIKILLGFLCKVMPLNKALSKVSTIGLASNEHLLLLEKHLILIIVVLLYTIVLEQFWQQNVE
jgi:hypothetical protein